MKDRQGVLAWQGNENEGTTAHHASAKMMEIITRCSRDDKSHTGGS